jgi:cyclopropane fatty-acyl-phospholipid synthase-like methyltransferase
MTASDVESRFRESKTGWFRSRTYHEHGVIRATVQPHVPLDDADILDFGCGAMPLAAASFALRYPKSRVQGTDIVAVDVAHLRDILDREAGLPLPPNLRLHALPTGALPSSLGQFDLIYAWSVFEHISEREIVNCFATVRDRLRPNGVFFFQIAPLYHSSKGSHLSRYASEPWHHLRHSIHDLRRMVFASNASQASKDREWQQFVELNRLTVDDFFDAAERAGLVRLWQQARFHCNDSGLRKCRDQPARHPAETTSEV